MHAAYTYYVVAFALLLICHGMLKTTSVRWQAVCVCVRGKTCVDRVEGKVLAGISYQWNRERGIKSNECREELGGP